MAFGQRRHAPLLLLAAALVFTGAHSAPASGATAAPPPAVAADGPPPVGAADHTGHSEHVAADALPVRERAPLPASREAQRADYDLPEAAHRAANECGIIGLTGSALADKVAASDLSCVNALFSLTGTDAQRTFSEAQMVTVAQRLRSVAAAYPGDDSTGAGRLVLFLRAGYYVQWYNPIVGEYGPALNAASRSALDAFFGGPRAFEVTERNGAVLSEAVVLIDSADLGARYLRVVKRLLNGYSDAYDQFPSMVNAVNSVHTVLFRGHNRPEFVAAVTADTGVLTALRDFALRNLGLLPGPRSYLTSNAGRELARFLQHDVLRPTVRPQVRQLLAVSSSTGATAPLWVGVAEMADSYDRANCSAYGVCDLQERLLAEVLPITHSCASTLRVRAQRITAAQLSQTCSSLLRQDAHFHDIARDTGPVAGDRNTSLEVIVYDSSTDYRTYAGAMWGIDTNNGGMYLEGDPSAAGNQARFIAYEAEWLLPEFAIWNLNHEYTHYLDGRFNLHGDFTSNVTTPTIWWIEGFAEYVSYSYRNLAYPEAITEAGKRTHALSTLFGTTYSHDTTRVYRWGYLAVRYMIQSRRSDVDTVLGLYRRGDWNGARSFLGTTVGSRYDSDWYSWLGRCAGGDCGTQQPGGECAEADARQLGNGCTRSNRSASGSGYDYLYLSMPAGKSQLRITSSGGTGNCDLYYSPRSWATAANATHRSTTSGNAESITVNSPPSGYLYVSLRGNPGCAGVSVSARF
ncbi:M9 family metallopeptidase [Actinokineospora guangxiensis]|uniref:microbial collagenase n=1 Tax=Actinokineospora guangxiensis TaxID=1490288 RepID=A0ABW0EMV5_9PSEU